jgi:DNA primase
VADWLEHIDVEDMLDVLDLLYERSGVNFRMACPFHEGLHNTFSVHHETTQFFCHKCKESGTAPDLVAHVLGVSPIEATRMLKERYHPGYINPDARNTVEEIRKILGRKVASVVQPQLSERELERFAVNWPEAWMAWRTPGWESFPACDYMFERGFEPETLEDWEFGYDEISGRVVFAVRDRQANLIGFKGRASDDRRPKYLVLGDSPGRGSRYGWSCYYTGSVVYGAHRIKPGVKTLVVLEGEFNAIAITEKLRLPAVAINGSNFTETQGRIIRELAERAVIFFDSDEAGDMATWGWVDHHDREHPGIVEQLRPFMSVHVVDPHEGDPMDLGADKLEGMISSAQPWTLASLAC